MGCLSQQPDGLHFLTTPGQRLKLQGKLGVQWAAGKNGALVAGFPHGGCGAGVGSRGSPRMIRLLGLVLFVLAGPGCRIHAGARDRDGLNLGGVVGLRPRGQLQLVALGVGDAKIPWLERGGECPEHCRQNEGRQYV
ncbi:MAG: hypothetical protein V7635_1741 [Arthrobacter sp.]